MHSAIPNADTPALVRCAQVGGTAGNSLPSKRLTFSTPAQPNTAIAAAHSTPATAAAGPGVRAACSEGDGPAHGAEGQGTPATAAAEADARTPTADADLPVREPMLG